MRKSIITLFSYSLQDDFLLGIAVQFEDIIVCLVKNKIKKDDNNLESEALKNQKTRQLILTNIKYVNNFFYLKLFKSRKTT